MLLLLRYDLVAMASENNMISLLWPPLTEIIPLTGKVTIEEGNKITLTMSKFGKNDGGKYTISITKEEGADPDTAETEVIAEDPKRDKKIRGMFNEIDKDKSGEITNEELGEALKKANPGMADEDVRMMIKESDENGDGKVDYNEFSMFMKKAGL